jgi:D-inositol-3-phosphate glycosyltransferase
MTQKGREIKAKPKLLWIGDAVAHTGFATVCHSVLEQLQDRYDVSVLGINYFGDPHPYRYPIYPAPIGGDVFGIKRIPALLSQIRPHVTCIVNDPWLVRDYIQPLKTPVGKINGQDAFTNTVAYMPIDGKNIQPEFIAPLNELGHAIFYTQFGLDEARKSGFTSEKTSIIPHGVDLKDFSRMSTSVARTKIPVVKDDWFVVGCINRNQPRKRLDLALQYFAEFARNKPDTVKFYYHGALQDVGWNILQLADYYGIAERMIITDPSMTTATGVPRDFLKYIYNSFDVQITTTLGEGWGLTQMEGMACGVPQIMPNWSALGEWAKDGATLIECTSEQANSGGLNTIGGIADKTAFIAAMNKLYYEKDERKKIGQAGYDLVRQPQFLWKNVADQFDAVFKKVMLQ